MIIIDTTSVKSYNTATVTFAVSEQAEGGPKSMGTLGTELSVTYVRALLEGLKSAQSEREYLERRELLKQAASKTGVDLAPEICKAVRDELHHRERIASHDHPTRFDLMLRDLALKLKMEDALQSIVRDWPLSVPNLELLILFSPEAMLARRRELVQFLLNTDCHVGSINNFTCLPNIEAMVIEAINSTTYLAADVELLADTIDDLWFSPDENPGISPELWVKYVAYDFVKFFTRDNGQGEYFPKQRFEKLTSAEQQKVYNLAIERLVELGKFTHAAKAAEMAGQESRQRELAHLAYWHCCDRNQFQEAAEFVARYGFSDERHAAEEAFKSRSPGSWSTFDELKWIHRFRLAISKKKAYHIIKDIGESAIESLLELNQREAVKDYLSEEPADHLEYLDPAHGLFSAEEVIGMIAKDWPNIVRYRAHMVERIYPGLSYLDKTHLEILTETLIRVWMPFGKKTTIVEFAHQHLDKEVVGLQRVALDLANQLAAEGKWKQLIHVASEWGLTKLLQEATELEKLILGPPEPVRKKPTQAGSRLSAALGR